VCVAALLWGKTFLELYKTCVACGCFVFLVLETCTQNTIMDNIEYSLSKHGCICVGLDEPPPLLCVCVCVCECVVI
jgi:hypothetical protein